MKDLYILLFSLSCLSLNSQLSGFSYNDKRIEEFKKNKTVVLLTGDKIFDSILVKSMSDIWIITKFDTLRQKGGGSMTLKKGYNYILSLTMMGGDPMVQKYSTNTSGLSSGMGAQLNSSFQKSSTLSAKIYHNYGVLVGEDKSINSYKYADMIAYTPVDFYGIENNQKNIYTRLPLVLYNLQNVIEIVLNDKIKGNPLGVAKKLRESFKKNIGILRDKTLLIFKDREKQLTEDQFKKKYPYNFEFCGMEKIMEAIENRDSRYAYYCPTITLNKSAFVYDLASYLVVHFDFQMTGLKVTDGDIADLADDIKKSTSSVLMNNYIKLKDKQTNKKDISNSNDSSTLTQSIANTSAIAHGEAANPSAGIAKNYKYKVDEATADYYMELRKKIEIEEAERKEKEKVLAVEKAKKDEEIKQSRRLSEGQAPQFDRFREGATNPVEVKTTAEDDYKKLFK